MNKSDNPQPHPQPRPQPGPQPRPPEAPGLIVGIDSATPISSVAVASLDGRLLAFLRRESRVQASRRLLADLDVLLRDEDLDPAQVRAVAVTTGPGMFTGLRVGLAVAKTLADGWGVPIYGYSTLESAARRWPVAGDIVCVLLDARRGEIYSGLYRVGSPDARPEPLRPDRPDRVEPIEAVLEELAASPWPVVVFSGSGAALYREAIAARLAGRVRWAAPPWDGPGADALALAGAADLRAGRPGEDPLAIMPVYLRVSDAERRHPNPIG